MLPVYDGMIKAVFVAGFGVLLAVALRLLPESPQARKIRRIAAVFALVVLGYLIVRAIRYG